MISTYKYIYFIEVETKGKTSRWECLSKSSQDVLGEVKWYGPWRQYCFFPKNAIFNKGCLEDINDFITQLMDLRKNKI